MQLVTVGAKYQIVIPKEVRAKMKGIKLGVKMSIHVQDADTIILRLVK